MPRPSKSSSEGFVEDEVESDLILGLGVGLGGEFDVDLEYFLLRTKQKMASQCLVKITVMVLFVEHLMVHLHVSPILHLVSAFL